MPSTGLNGPYILTAENIDKVILRRSAGTYALDRSNDMDAFHVCCVGRSDNNLNARLKSYIGGEYNYFKYGYSPSPKAAFERECELYHDWNPPDNETHPDRPKGTNFGCPVDGCDALD